MRDNILKNTVFLDIITDRMLENDMNEDMLFMRFEKAIGLSSTDYSQTSPLDGGISEDWAVFGYSGNTISEIDGQTITTEMKRFLTNTNVFHLKAGTKFKFGSSSSTGGVYGWAVPCGYPSRD